MPTVAWIQHYATMLANYRFNVQVHLDHWIIIDILIFLKQVYDVMKEVIIGKVIIKRKKKKLCIDFITVM